MPKPLNDLWPGKRFGRLVLIERQRNPTFHDKRWLCHCDCGAESLVFPSGLRKGTTRSCGCLLREHYAKQRATSKALTKVRNQYQSKARERGIFWGIGDDVFAALVAENCVYCGAPPSNKMHDRYGVPLIYSGVDRNDNSRGYIPGNVVPCCKRCNVAKSDMTYEEFKDWAARLVERINPKAVEPA